MNIFLPIEWSNRELDSRLLLTSSILQTSKNKKVNIYIGNMKKLGRISEKINDYYVWLASGIDLALERFIRLSNSKGIFVSLDEEGGVFTKNEDKFFPRHKIPLKLGHLASRIFIWGNNEGNKFKSNYKLNSKNSLVVSGNPRFDLAKKKFYSYYKNPKYKKDVLINTAFGLANPDIPLKNEFLFWKSKAESKNFILSLFNSKFEDITNYQKKNLDQFLIEIKQLVKKFKNLSFGIRVHPAENRDTYLKYFKNEKNMKILDNSHSVLYNIFNSKVVIHPGCTSAIETFFSKKKTICHINFRDKNNEQYLPVRVSDISNNYMQLENLLKKHLKNTKFKIDREVELKKYLSKYFNNVNVDSYKIISKEILELNLKSENKNLIDKVNKLKKKKNSNLIWRIQRKLINLSFKNKIKKISRLIKTRQKRKFFKIEKKFIQNKIKKINLINKYNYRINIKKINSECFLISRG